MAKKGTSPAEQVEPLQPGFSIRVAEDTIESFLNKAGASTVYGEPVEHGDTVMIPAAEVTAGIGFGVGHGYGHGEEVEGSSTGEGGGGGGKTFSRPVAVVVATPEGVYIEPVRDPTKVLLAGITAAGFMAAMILRMVSPKRALKEMKGE